ncbi:hypothetical protein [Kitasatospora sp. P5_F3]
MGQRQEPLRSGLTGALPDVYVACAPGTGFGIGLRELQGQEGVDVLCGFLSVTGRRLGRPGP